MTRQCWYGRSALRPYLQRVMPLVLAQRLLHLLHHLVDAEAGRLHARWELTEGGEELLYDELVAERGGLWATGCRP